VIFFDIDTQVDFLVPSGALYVPGATAIHDSIQQLLEAAKRYGVTTFSTCCAHEPGDPEFVQFPPHCLIGTPGAERLYSALPGLPRHQIPVDGRPPRGERGERWHEILLGHHYLVEKKAFDLFSNEWLNRLRESGAFQGVECVVFGVATDFCVRACVLGLVASSAKVWVVRDAIRGVAPKSTEETLLEWEQAGVHWTTTAEIVSRLEDQAALVAT
jgi:nicotinamidase/pyrazinamidase